MDQQRSARCKCATHSIYVSSTQKSKLSISRNNLLIHERYFKNLYRIQIHLNFSHAKNQSIENCQKLWRMFQRDLIDELSSGFRCAHASLRLYQFLTVLLALCHTSHQAQPSMSVIKFTQHFHIVCMIFNSALYILYIFADIGIAKIQNNQKFYSN